MQIAANNNCVFSFGSRSFWRILRLGIVNRSFDLDPFRSLNCLLLPINAAPFGDLPPTQRKLNRNDIREAIKSNNISTTEAEAQIPVLEMTRSSLSVLGRQPWLLELSQGDIKQLRKDGTHLQKCTR
jgi:hypothetical protein